MNLRFRKYLTWQFPKFNELTAFLTAFICLLLLFSYPEFSEFFSTSLSDAPRKAEGWVVTMGFGALFGFFLSFIHVFTNRPKSYVEKMFIALFALGANSIAGIVSGIEMLSASWSGWAIFPIWNIVTGAVLFYQLGLSDNLISDENASLLEVLLASIILIVVFFIAYFRLQLSWALTFSICMFYTSIITSVLNWAIHFFILQKRNT